MSRCTFCKEEHKDHNTGCKNSGNFNSGNRNSGYFNSGWFNSGNLNSGDFNSGNRNSGWFNSGNLNSGNLNSGNFNSGDYNSGDCNSGDRNSGWFNTNEPKMRFFNKESNMTYSEFLERDMVYPDLKVTAWVGFKDLPKDEQTKEASQRGGTLKTLSYKEAWKEYWGRASDSDKKWFKNLPNFDSAIFKEITGIDIEDTLNLAGQEVEVKIGGKTYKAVIKE